MYSKNVVKSLAVYKEISERDSWRCIGKIRKTPGGVKEKSERPLAVYRKNQKDPWRCIGYIRETPGGVKEKSERPLAVYRKNQRKITGGV